MQEDVRLFELCNHLVCIGDEVRGQVTAVKLHAFNNVELSVEGFGFLNGDDAFIADLVHGLGNHVAKFFFAIGRDGADLGNFAGVFDGLGRGFDFSNDDFDSLVDAALEIHWVHAGGYRLHAFANDGLTENGRCCCAVACNIIGLGGDFAHHLRAHVFELVGQLDLFGDRNAILCGAWCAKGFVDHDIATFRAERHFDSVGECVDALEHALTCVGGKKYVFSHVIGSVLNVALKGGLLIKRPSHRECRTLS